MSLLFDWRKAIAASELPPTQRLVAFVLSLHMRADGDSCYPSMATIGLEAGLGERAARNAVRGLEGAGFLELVYGRGGQGKANEWRARLPDTRHPGAAFDGSYTRHDGGPKAAPESSKPGTQVPPRTTGERQRERPPQPPKGGEQHRGADAQEEDRLAALDASLRSPLDAGEEAAADAAH